MSTEENGATMHYNYMLAFAAPIATFRKHCQILLPQCTKTNLRLESRQRNYAALLCGKCQTRASLPQEEDRNLGIEQRPPPTRERNIVERSLAYKLRANEEVGIRIGYLLATLAAGLAGGGTLASTSASFLLLGATVQAPPVLSMSISLLLAVGYDLFRGSYGSVFGLESPNLTILPILLYISTSLVTFSVDPDAQLQPPPSTPKKALERMKAAQDEELRQIDADERGEIRRELGLEETDDKERRIATQRNSQLYEWDRNYLEGNPSDKEGDSSRENYEK